MKKIQLLTAVLISAISFSAVAADPEVTPYRPGVGSPAVLSAPGYFELESGYDYAKGAGIRSDGIGLTLKYGISDTLGLIIGVNPYLRVRGFGESETGISDASFGLKYVTKMNETSALGAQLVTTLPTGSRAFRSDNPNVTLTGLAGFDFSGFHSDINLGWTRLGDAPLGVSRNRFGWSASLGRALSGPVSAALEVSGTRQSGVNGTQVLASLAYAVNKQLVLDAYVARARVEGVNATGAGFGMTYLFAK
jgi:hypothetical protein